jgi:KipI family sensor histidine kinase inhibitor
MRILPCGEHALLVELDDASSAAALHRALCESRPHGVLDLVPGEQTVLVTVIPGITPLSQLAHQLSTRVSSPVAPTDRGEVILPVTYDGPDLERVCDMTGLTADRLIECHSRQVWTVAFTGFAPGFGYMTSHEWTHSIPRHSESRLKVRAGAVGLAGRYCGIYPIDSPGGWQIIGHTPARTWDLTRESPALLVPGMHVAFVRA